MKNSSNHVFWLQILNYETCVLAYLRKERNCTLFVFLLIDGKVFKLQMASVELTQYARTVVSTSIQRRFNVMDVV